MNEKESLLVIIAFIYMMTLYGIVLFKGPRLNMFSKARFDGAKLGTYIKLLSATLVVSGVIGYLISRKFIVTVEYIGLNVLIAAIMGGNLLLFREGDKRSK